MTIKRYNQAFHEMAGCFMQPQPEGEYVTWEDVEKLAAENVAIKAMNDALSEELRGYESDGAFDGPNMHKLWYSHSGALPATDALANQLRAEGVEMFAAWSSQQEQFARESRDAGSALINRNCEARAKSFAAALREKGEGK